MERGCFAIERQQLQTILEYVDNHIGEKITGRLLSQIAGYSVCHFTRIFADALGISPMAYVTWRRLQIALYDISMGKMILDAAIGCGFETHAGFTKAFKRYYGFPPSLCYTRVRATPPGLVSIETLQNRFTGGRVMNPHIIELTPFTAAGRTLRRKLPRVARHSDIPAYCFHGSVEAETEALLNNTEKLFPKSKHCEISICYDANPESGEFTYLLGRGITNPDDLVHIPPDMVRFEISGLYAVFSTPPVDQGQREQYIKVIQDTWNDILLQWLPNSEFEYDDTRKDFEYYDRRDHGWYFDGKRQMDICIPIRQREEAKRKSQQKDERYWQEETKRKEQLKKA